MKILITGGAGFIGSHLADHVLAKGDTVTVIDNMATGNPKNLAPHNALKVIEGTIADRKLVETVFDECKPDLVIHAAASYKDPENWLEDVQTNVTGTANIVRASQKAGVKRLIYFQTALCYGLKPIEQPITLNHPIMSSGSSYAISKTAAEQYIELSGLNYISFRLANVYGPRNVSGPLPTFFQRLTTGKDCFVMDTRRDFIFVKDLVDIVSKAIYGAGEKGMYHVSSGRDFSIKELFDATIKAMGIKLEREVEVRPRGADDAFSILLDPSKTERDFHWKVSTPLELGVAEAIRSYEKNSVGETYTHLKIKG